MNKIYLSAISRALRGSPLERNRDRQTELRTVLPAHDPGGGCRPWGPWLQGREILVKDAHDSGRNIDPEELPDCVRIFRGWGSDPYCMMSGLDESFDGVLFTGYHSAAGAGDNPLSHTMDTGVLALTINDELASELMINSLTAAMLGVPVLFVSGDEGLCHWMDRRCPGVVTVPVSRGVGPGSISLPPRLACRRIREGVQKPWSGIRRAASSRCPIPLRQRSPSETTIWPVGRVFTPAPGRAAPQRPVSEPGVP